MTTTNFRNLLEVGSVPVDCTITEVDARIQVAAGGSKAYDKIHFDDTSYENFRNSKNIHEEGSNESGTPPPLNYPVFPASKATAIHSTYLERKVEIINAFPDLMKLYNAKYVV